MKRLTATTALLTALACAATPGAARGALVTFGLSPATVTPTSATFGVSMEFTGGANDRVEAIQLSVVGSSPALTASNYKLFTFTPNATVLAGWSQLAPIAGSGFNLLAPDDPVNGPFLGPSGTPYSLGTLAVDLTGFAAGRSFTVTLAGGTPGTTGTDAGGVVGGTFYPSFATAGSAVQVRFAQPGGVSVTTVPEPTGLTLLGLGLLALAACAGRARRR